MLGDGDHRIDGIRPYRPVDIRPVLRVRPGRTGVVRAVLCGELGHQKGVRLFLRRPTGPDCVEVHGLELHNVLPSVDDEGNPCGRTVLVENGILRSYLHDTISSHQYDVPTTGSGRRQSYKFEPMPRMTCTFMENGPHTNEEIIAAVDHGIIAETYTNGQVRIGEGDYTFYVKNGWLIEKGKVTAPIRDVNIIGNGPEDLTRITMVADNAEMDAGGWTCGKNGQSVPVSLGMPSVLVSKMTVGGQNVS